MRKVMNLPVTRVALITAILMCACAGDRDPTAPPTAAVSGVVRDANGAVIAGASVKIGGATATTGANGRFEIQNLPVGSVTITITAEGFDPRSESVSLVAGSNVRDVTLTPQQITPPVTPPVTPPADQALFTHGNVVAYLRPGVAEYKAAIVFLPGLRDPATGLDLDSRPLVRGTSELQCSIWCSASERTQVRNRALQVLGGNVALIGTSTLVDNPTSYQTLLDALTQLGTQSNHPELANIPIFFVGHSMGGCTAYGFTRVHGARVAGFLTMKGGCHNPAPAAAAATVPGYFLIGALDEPHRKNNITPVFEIGRAGGAPWALSTDDFHHGPILDFDLMFAWIDAVLAARLPETAGGPLRPITENAGWLGNRSNGSIATYACYAGERLGAAWLPSESTAVLWQRMAKGTGKLSGC
jgi:pimeloyl-ACP methyl ester carboxylesterase